MNESHDGASGRVLALKPGRAPRQLCLTAIADLDLTTESQAQAELRRALRRSGYDQCWLDVSGVFVDVRGLAVLLEAAARAERDGWRLAVAPSTSVIRMSQALGLGSRLGLLDGLSGAYGADLT